MNLSGAPVLLGFSSAALLLSALYFRHYQIERPPIGLFNHEDVAILGVLIVLVPYLYLDLPAWAVVALFGLSTVGLLSLVLEPMLRSHRILWLVVLTAAGSEIALHQFGARNYPSIILHNSIVIGTVIGATNLWAQSGMRARDLACLAVALTLYDYTFTVQFPLMSDLFDQMTGMPFAPLVVWPTSDNTWTRLGLGDLLLAAVFPLVMRRAYGERAAAIALWSALGVLAILIIVLPQFAPAFIFPVMALLGPLMGLHYLFWRRRYGPERTTHHYLQIEPLPSRRPF